ncbi:MAG: hypothetical protein KGR26_11855, partial [Cyanobacteria bacterium REEB65]|nr:hypothetical protein [Cyanobacteria bacterium REEB65]
MLRKLKIWHKLVLIAFSLFVPFLVATVILIQDKDSNIDFSAKERVGVIYLKPANKFLKAVASYWEVARSHSMAAADQKAALTDEQTAIDAMLPDIDAVDAKYAKDLQATGQWKTVKDDWTAVKAKVANPAAKGDWPDILDDSLSWIVHVADTSNLTLDPDIDSYYLMDLTTVKWPFQVSELTQLAVLGDKVATRGKMSADDRTQFVVI